MTWIKICGMTNLDDALVAVDAGADAVGFVFCKESPRKISVAQARQIANDLPEEPEKIGVFMGDEMEPWNVLLEAGLTGVQTYLLPQERQARQKGTRGIDVSLLPDRARSMLALPMGMLGEDLQRITSLASGLRNWWKNAGGTSPLPSGLLDTIVLDSGDLKQPGGTGKTFNWSAAVPVSEAMRQNNLKLVVAGGLTPQNVAEAIAILRPWGVDVASGVEARPGKKDPEKVRAFVRAVRAAERPI